MDKIVYQTDRAGLYLGTTVADESPRQPGVFLLPARCVTEAPPDQADWPTDKWPRWNGSAWEFVIDPAIAQIEISPETSLAKLQQFLSDNPDVAALIGTTTPNV